MVFHNATSLCGDKVMEDARRPPYDPHLVCFTYEERGTSGSGYGF